MVRRFYGHVGLGRRDLIKAIGAAGAGLALTTACSSQKSNSSAPQQAASPSPAAQPVAVTQRPDAENMSPDEALKLLMEGNERFVAGQSIHPRGSVKRIRETAVDQFPYAAFLSCADSRVPIEEVFDQGIGDCFVCRVAGNVATEQDIGSLEFGTLVLGSRILVVVGHERCGAVLAAMGRLALPKNPGDIPSLVPLIQPAVTAIQKKVEKEGVAAVGDDVDATIKVNVHNQVSTLKKSPILSQLEKEGKLKIVAAYYDLDTGKMQILEPPKA